MMTQERVFAKHYPDEVCIRRNGEGCGHCGRFAPFGGEDSPRAVDDDPRAQVDREDEGLCGVKPEAAVADRGDAAGEAF